MRSVYHCCPVHLVQDNTLRMQTVNCLFLPQAPHRVWKSCLFDGLCCGYMSTALFFRASLCVWVLGKTSISDCRHHSEVTSYSSGFEVAVKNPLYIKHCLCWKDIHKTFQYICRRPEHYSYISTNLAYALPPFQFTVFTRHLDPWVVVDTLCWCFGMLPQYHGHKWSQP
jgi:hypothetical protein